jgi:uncharacterized protein (DUF427 family)
MSARVLDMLLPRLRHEPARTRVRALLTSEVVVDSVEAVLVWEPQRVLPAYAVPREHVRGALFPAPPASAPPGPHGFRLANGQTVLDPSVPFAVHTTEGEPLSLHAAGQTRHGVAFQAADPDLRDHVILDFAGFDAWYEEDEPRLGHPPDILGRLDILPSSRSVRIELHGTLLAHSTRAYQLREHPILPVRCYLPPDDVRVPLRPSPTRTHCPRKGEAGYWSFDLDGRTVHDLAWSYQDPRPQAALLAGLVCFFNERVEMSLDGRLQPRPLTPWT